MWSMVVGGCVIGTCLGDVLLLTIFEKQKSRQNKLLFWRDFLARGLHAWEVEAPTETYAESL